MDRVEEFQEGDVQLENYKEVIEKLLDGYVADRPQTDDVETQVVVDPKNHHYQLVNVGWVNKRRIYGCVLHIDIKNHKVWIQHNGTEHFVAEDLVALGIPKQDIILGFHSPYRRQLTEFGVN